MDFSFQLFSPLRQAPERKKKKKHIDDSTEQTSIANGVGNSNGLTLSDSPKRKHTKHKRIKELEEEISQRTVPIVPSSNVDSDSNVDEDILSLAKEVSTNFDDNMSPKKRSTFSDGPSPKKRSRLAEDGAGPLTSTQISEKSSGHAMSSGGDSSDDDASMSQSILTGKKPPLPAAQKKGRVSPDLFSNLDSETDAEQHLPFTQVTAKSPMKRPILSAHAIKKEKISPKKPTPVNSPMKAAKVKVESNSSSSSGSESEAETGMVPVSSRGGQQSSSSESGSDSDSEQETQSAPVPVPKKKAPPTKLKYECPVGFREVEFMDAPLTVEDLDDKKEIWLFRIPADYNVSKLDNKKFMADSVMQIGKESDVHFEMHSSRIKKTMHKTSLLLPSKADNKLHYAGQPVGQMWLSESHIIPPVVLPKPKPLRDTSLPPGLKMRNIPFGAGCPSHSKNTSGNTTPSRRKRKKIKREEEVESMDTVDCSELNQTLEDNSQMESERKKAKKKKKKRETLDPDLTMDTMGSSVEFTDAQEDTSQLESGQKQKKKKKKHKKDKKET